MYSCKDMANNSDSYSLNNSINSSNKNNLLALQTSAFTIVDMLARSKLISQAICIVAKLKIADYLKDGPKSVDELAEESKTHPDSLYRLLRMLASLGIFAALIIILLLLSPFIYCVNYHLQNTNSIVPDSLNPCFIFLNVDKSILEISYQVN
jgi:hypothetical protein